MENPRTTSARDHDDHEMIDAAIEDGGIGQASRSGGRLAVDVATQDELVHDVTDPGGTTRPEKSDKIANDTAHASSRSAD